MSLDGPTPYFLLPGTARAALEFYQGVFGGEVRVNTFADLGRTDGDPASVAHGMLVGDVGLFAADMGTGETPFAASGLLLSLLGAAPPNMLRRWFADLSVGGTVLDPLQERPWGDSDGQVRDAYGVTWLLGYEASAAD